MLSGDKNIKDGVMDLDVSRKDSILSMSYTKTQKLVTALYIVTDIIDKEEPIRNKLRTLGVEILSDTSSMSKTLFDIEDVSDRISTPNVLNLFLIGSSLSIMSVTI